MARNRDYDNPYGDKPHDDDNSKGDGKNMNVDVDIDKDVYAKKLALDASASLALDVDVDKNVDINKSHSVSHDFKTTYAFEKQHTDVYVDVKADKLIQDSKIDKLEDNDANDFDNQNLLNVNEWATLDMDDFTVENLGIANSFNGKGNDMQFNVDQSNELVDDDTLKHPQVVFEQQPWVKGSTFQDISAEGGYADADDGIDGDIKGKVSSDNDGDGTVTGLAEASADGVVSADAFTQDITMGANSQGNVAELNVTGGNTLAADDIGQGKHGGHHGDKNGHGDGDYDAASSYGGGDWPDHGGGDDHKDGDGIVIKDSEITKTFDDDYNDIDNQGLVNIDGDAWMDDFSLDNVAIADSFNGPGNDMQFDVGQVNDLVDNDTLYNPTVTYDGGGHYATKGYDGGYGGSPFQDIHVDGGSAYADDGIDGDIYGEHGGIASNNGGNGAVTGATQASADAIAQVEAFTQNIVMGANVQFNGFDATVVGGNSTVADNMDEA